MNIGIALCLAIAIAVFVWQAARLLPRLYTAWQRWRQRYECMGFTVHSFIVDGQERHGVDDCDKRMKRDAVHVIAESDVSAVGPDMAERNKHSSADGAVVYREYCDAHCTGGCDKGCEAQHETA